MIDPMDVVLVGATGAVGQEMLRVLEQRAFPVRQLRAIASPRSAGGTVTFRGQALTLQAPSASAFAGAAVALFSAGSSIALEWGPIGAAAGCLIVDNSSAFRMDDDVPLVVPEVNGHRIPPRGGAVVANPNCSTIQMLMALKPLHDLAGLEHIVVSTYQAISGKGARAVDEFERQQSALLAGEIPPTEILPGVLAGNLLADWKHEPSGFSEEEIKIVAESRKILEIPGLRISPTCVRVPVRNAHSQSVWARFRRPITRAEAIACLRAAPGVVVDDRIGPGQHPQPRQVSGGNDVAVGRIRQDLDDPQALSLWIVGDNLRKGAALNAVQIAERAFGVTPPTSA
jgi:aspartate-semialdehyde dehydrogenase